MAQTPTADQLGRLVELYIGYFNRAPEADGLNYWSGVLLELLGQGQTEAQAMATIADQFYDLGIEYEVYDPDMDTEAFIMLAYQNVLGRDLDNEPQENKDEALGWWGPQLEDGSLSKGQFILNLIDAAKEYAGDPEWGWVPKYLEARQQAGLLFAQSELGDIADPDEAIAKGQAVLAPISPVTFQQNPDADPAEVARQAFDSWKAEEIGQTFTLTTGVDIIEGTAGDDTIEGVAASLSSARTLNAGDQIDGGEGNDTLNVDLQGNFTGFTGDGFLKNVETVNLTNTGTIARSFAAKGVEGVETYNLTGAINLSDLATTDAAVNLAERASGTTTIAFADKVTDGTADALALGLTNIGTVEVKNAAGTVTTAEAAVTVTANGIEELNITATGANVAKLGSNDATALTITGDGSLKLTGTGSGVKSVDAATHTGGLDIDLADATGVTTLVTGAGDDTIRATGNNLAINAEINGGEGADTLILKGAINTVQYRMSGVETIEIDAVTAMTFSATNTTGVENLVVKGNNTANFANMGAADLNITLSKAATGKVTSDHAGASTVTVTGGTKATPTEATANLTLNKTSSVDLTVDQYNTLTGGITAAAAQSFTADIAGKMNNTVALAAATSAVFTTHKGSDTTVALKADKLTDLVVTNAGTFTLKGNLAALEALTVATSGAFTATDVDLAKVASVELSGAGSAAAVTLGDLGDAELDYGITVTAEGLAAGLKIGDIKTGEGQSVTVDVAGVLGDVAIGDVTVAESADPAAKGSITIDANGTAGDIKLGALEAKSVTVDASGALKTVGADVNAETATFYGSELGANKVDITASKSATVTGGIGDDAITVTGDAGTGEVATFTITTGLGKDVIDVSANTGSGAVRVTITDFSAGVDKVSGFTANTTALDAAGFAAFLTDALGTEVADTAISTAYDGSYADGIFVYNNTVHAVLDVGGGDNKNEPNGEFDDGDIFITFTGVTEADVSKAADLFGTST